MIIVIFPTCEFFKEWNGEEPIFTDKIAEAKQYSVENNINANQIEDLFKLRNLKYYAKIFNYKP